VANASYRLAAAWLMSIGRSPHCAPQPKCEVTIHGYQSNTARLLMPKLVTPYSNN
jgi:hypothetical protein